jgi:hypothetical protein
VKRHAYRFGAHIVSHIVVFQHDVAVNETTGQGACQCSNARFVVKRDTFAQRHQGSQAVQRARIEVMETQMFGNAMGDGSFAGSGRAINRNYGILICHFGEYPSILLYCRHKQRPFLYTGGSIKTAPDG